MNFIGNLLWLVLGGLIISLVYFFMGLVFCITIIGIPFGIQLFKIGGYALWPFGSDVRSTESDGGCLSIIMNVLWILFGGIEVAMMHITFGIVCCITIIGIPFGLQHFKMAILAFVPFGKEVV